MKKLSFLFVLLLAFTVSAMAQSTLPKPGNPKITQWIDYGVYVWEEGYYNAGSLAGYTLAKDVMGQLVADDYTVEAYYTGGEYTFKKTEKVSFSIFTDNDQIFTFTPEMFDQVDEPVTQFPYTSVTAWGNVGNSMITFEELTNDVDVLAEMGIVLDRFFNWRIGIQTQYTDNGQMTTSDIVYMEIYPQLKEAANVTQTSFLADWSCNEENTYIINNFVGDGCGYFLYVIDKATQDTVLIQNVVPTNTYVDDYGHTNYLPGATYTVEGLTPGATYEYFVIVIQNTGASFKSVVREVTLPTVPTVIRGDVNGNGFVNMDDLTALINYLVFGTPINMANSAACSSVDDTTIVNMDDLTALINYLVYNQWAD